MKIAIIGAGFTGLAAAWELAKHQHEVTVFESEAQAGGLAGGFGEKAWAWTLEKHYHHVFQTDIAIRNLLLEMDLQNLLFFSDVKTATLYQGETHRLDSPSTLLSFSPLSFFSRLRTGVTLALFKLDPVGTWWDRWTAETVLTKLMGQEAWEVLWKPLFVGKFGEYASEVNAAWFWARIHARSQKLGYFTGGFQELANQMVERLETTQRVHFRFSTKITQITESDGRVKVKLGTEMLDFDQVLVTAPAPVLTALCPQLPKEMVAPLRKLPSLAAQTLVLQLTKPFFSDDTYWLNINEPGWPFLAVVEHTHLAQSKQYGHHHLVYVGKYLKADAEPYTLTKEELLKRYQPYLEKLSPGFTKNIRQTWLFRADFAQPVVKPNHRLLVPSFSTPLAKIWWASMQHVYPWDRGTNFAVKAGRDVAQQIMNANETNLDT